jgi:hypothetical protein
MLFVDEVGFEKRGRLPDALRVAHGLNLHAHGLYFGPRLEWARTRDLWMEITKAKFGVESRGFYISAVKRFAENPGRAIRWALSIKQMLDGKLPGAPRIYFGVVDVRDVVEIHKLAMTHPAAAGERFIAVAGAPMSILQVARALRTQLGSAANKAPNRELPDWLIRLLALFSPNARRVVPDLGKIRAASNQKAKALLGWSPRSGETAVVASGESLLRLSA